MFSGTSTISKESKRINKAPESPCLLVNLAQSVTLHFSHVKVYYVECLAFEMFLIVIVNKANKSKY